MSLNSTPSGERIHIGFFGKRNTGKSSLVNAFTGQNIAIVSDIKGTTTDPVYKAMELLPIGPVEIIDTPGLDDEGTLGMLRIEKTKQVLSRVDIAILVIDAGTGLDYVDYELLTIFKKNNINYIIAYNKCDLISEKKILENNELYTSAKNNINIKELKELTASLYKEDKRKNTLVKDLISKNDIVILVTPIDSAAPKGRLILPQQQVIRDILEANAVSIVIQEQELKNILENINKKPKLVITDSQVFEKVSSQTPDDIFLTSFSILFARYKGILEQAINGAEKIKTLKDNDTILISEGCTHHRQCDDIGTVKLPNWLKKYTNKNLNFEFSSGISFPEDLKKYKLIIHCGGCMLNDREVKNRYEKANQQQIPITNYGIAISLMHGILNRSIKVFSN